VSDSTVSCVVDASAVLAYLQGEAGGDRVEARLEAAAICAVNLSEVAAKLLEVGMPEEEAREVLGSLGLAVIPFDEELAWGAASLRAAGRPYGLSLGDRACLASGIALGLPVVGADRAWAQLDLPVPFEAIR